MRGIKGTSPRYEYNKQYWANLSEEKKEVVRARMRATNARDREKYRLKSKAWRDSPEGKRACRSVKLKQAYGITIEQFESMVELQCGKCASCEERPAEFVDHCHATGEVRGILCPGCNTGIGMFAEKEAYFLKAVEYLKKANKRIEGEK